METGERIVMDDLIADREGWAILREAVDTTVRAYFPNRQPDEAALAALLTQDGLKNLDFTLHGMSLVIHIPTQSVYPEGKHTLIEVPVYYPDIRPHMSPRAWDQTDNLQYYKTVALTFDDGPDRVNTTKVLNNLLETGARATFFVLGNRICDNADMVQREHDEGHAVASHNYSHGNVSKMSADAIRAQKTKFDEACIPTIGITARYARVPYGLYNQMIDNDAGVPLVQWSIDTYDWRGRYPSTIMKNIKKQFTDGDIVLMHDIEDNTPKTAKVLVQWLQEKGYMILTMDELFAKDGVELQENVVYFRCDDGDTTIKKRD